MLSDENSQLEREKFLFHRDLVKKWDNPSTIGAFLFSIALTITLILSFIGIATIPEAVQIFMIGVIMFILIFRYFKEITVGAITGKPGAGVRQYFYSGSPIRLGATPDPQEKDDKPTLPKA